MEQRESKSDVLGNKFGDEYSLIVTDPYFENRLKLFDPNLKLMFDQVQKCWTILEWAQDNSGWNIILRAKDSHGHPKPLGEWVFNKLFVYRHNYNDKRENPNRHFNELIQKAEQNAARIEANIRQESQAKIIDDINLWRKAARELSNRPVSDVTAGYQFNPTKKPKGIVYG